MVSSPTPGCAGNGRRVSLPATEDVVSAVGMLVERRALPGFLAGATALFFRASGISGLVVSWSLDDVVLHALRGLCSHAVPKQRRVHLRSATTASGHTAPLVYLPAMPHGKPH